MSEKTVKEGVFKGYTVGDKVWNFEEKSWANIVEVRGNSDYPIRLEDGTIYTSDGKIHLSLPIASIFPNEWKIPDEAFVKPLPKLEIDTKVLVWNYNEQKELAHKEYFSHFREDGRLYTFQNGRTSWTGEHYPTIGWGNYEVVEGENE